MRRWLRLAIVLVPPLLLAGIRLRGARRIAITFADGRGFFAA